MKINRLAHHLTVLLFLASPAFAQQEVRLKAAAQARAGIVSRPVLERAFGERISVIGEVVRAPGTTLTVKTTVDGRVAELLVSPGKPVQAGEGLMRIHSHEIQALEGDLLKAIDAHRLAKSRLAAGEQLLEIGGISRLEVDQRRQQAMSAKIQMERIRHELVDLGYRESDVQAAIERQRPEGYLTIASPVAGVVLELDVHSQEWFVAFDPLVVIGDPTRLELEVQIAPTEFDLVDQGDLIEFVPVGRTDLIGRARVLTRIPMVDPVTRTVTVRAAIEHADTRLVPGLYVQGQLLRGASRAAPSVPEKAVIRIGHGDYVFVRRNSELFEAREVKLGQWNGQRYEIKSGVAPGEEVVVQGVFFLKSVLVTGEGE